MKTDEEKQLEPVDRSKGQWYVLQTGTGRENKVNRFELFFFVCLHGIHRPGLERD